MLSKEKGHWYPPQEDTAPLQAEGVKYTKAEIKGERRDRDSQKNQGSPVQKEAIKGER